MIDKKFFTDVNGKPSIKRIMIAFFSLLYAVLFFTNLYFGKNVTENIQASIIDIMKYLIVAIFAEPIANKVGVNFGKPAAPVAPPAGGG